MPAWVAWQVAFRTGEIVAVAACKTDYVVRRQRMPRPRTLHRAQPPKRLAIVRVKTCDVYGDSPVSAAVRRHDASWQQGVE